MDVRFPGVTVNLSNGVNGNARAIIAAVTGGLRAAGLRDEAAQFQEDALASESYDALLQLALSTVEVT